MAGTFIFLFLLFFLGGPISDCLQKCFPSLIIGDVEIDEEIDNYWKALDEDDRKWSIMEEANTRRACSGMSKGMLTDAQKDALENAEQSKGKTLQGVHSYDVLANPLYLDDFQYVSAVEGEDRCDMIIDDDAEEGNDAAQSDNVRIILNLAYLTEKEATAFTFDGQAARALADAERNGVN